MDTIEMLNRLKSKDFKAYCQLTENYGQKLYSHIRDRFDDKEKANAAFHETLVDFCGSITDFGGDDVIEYLLLACAEDVCDRMERESRDADEITWGTEKAQKKSAVSAHKKAKKTKRPVSGSGRLGFGLCIALLVLGMAAALWVILGLLMDMNLIPQIDLGYEWFNLHVAPWF
ncbi:MAG: hypothetical protein ACI4IT_05610 [Oscillospiraceae bacterium]